jgi:hypothetical protein
MKPILRALLGAGLVFVWASSSAIVPGMPPIIAGFDGIAPQQIAIVLAEFCKSNGCDVQRVSESTQGGSWNLTVGNTTPISVGGRGRRTQYFSHEYYVVAGEDVGEGFVTVARVQQLKHMLEAKGAKVTLMDCHGEWGKGGRHYYVCAHGNSPP